ncbi:Splicing factor 1, partial [Perkinsus olseni]
KGHRELFVHFSGDDEDRVQEAVEFIKKCLTPGSREYEALQSRGRDTLAVINGTVGIGSNYHQRQLRVLEADGLDEIERWRAVARHVRCEICGDRGHPTVDCPQRRMPSHDELMEDWRLDKEYHDLMASVSPEASPSSDGQPPLKRQHTESLSQQEEEILSPPELPPMPLPPPMEATPKLSPLGHGDSGVHWPPILFELSQWTRHLLRPALTMPRDPIPSTTWAMLLVLPRTATLVEGCSLRHPYPQ